LFFALLKNLVRWAKLLFGLLLNMEWAQNVTTDRCRHTRNW